MGVRIGHGGGFGDSQRWDIDTRGAPWSGERVERFVVNSTVDPRWDGVLGAGLVSEVCNNVEHPIPETEVFHRWNSDLGFDLFRLVENRLDFTFFLGDLLIDIAFLESSALRGNHFAEVASLDDLQIIPVASLNVNTVFHHNREVFGADLAEVMGDDDSSLILAPPFDCLKNQNTGSGIESGKSLIYVKG